MKPLGNAVAVASHHQNTAGRTMSSRQVDRIGTFEVGARGGPAVFQKNLKWSNDNEAAGHRCLRSMQLHLVCGASDRLKNTIGVSLEALPLTERNFPQFQLFQDRMANFSITSAGRSESHPVPM